MFHIPQLSTSSQIFSREDAQRMLRSFSPGSKEHCEMQNLLIKTGRIVQVNLGGNDYRFDTVDRSKQLLGGGSPSENLLISENIELHELPADEPLVFRPRHSGKVAEVQFKHIVALAGDFYGTVDQSISLYNDNGLKENSDQEKIKRFKQAFNTLSKKAEGNQVYKIVNEITQESKMIEDLEIPRHCYSSWQTKKSCNVKKIKEDIDQLFIDNGDQFSEEAREVYRIGHTLAQIEAEEAGRKNDVEGLKRAYALDAFACHFLINLFSAGHIRNQRGPLETYLQKTFELSHQIAKVFAGLLTAVQHEKDGCNGLNVYNEEGEKWRAYGDGRFLIDENKKNKAQTIAAIQQSINEVYKAYNPHFSAESNRISRLIPCVSPLNPPSFYWVNKEGLFLGRDSYEKITSIADYLRLVIPEAIECLPEGYIDEFICKFLAPCDNSGILDLLKSGGVVLGDKAKILKTKLRQSFLKDPKVFLESGLSIREVNGVVLERGSVIDNQMVDPQIEQLIAPIWHIVELAPYHQHEKPSEKFYEQKIADVVQKTYEDTQSILAKMNELADSRKCKYHLEKINKSMRLLQEQLNQKDSHEEARDFNQLKEAKQYFQNIYTNLGMILRDGFPSNQMLLSEYAELLLEKNSMPFDKRIETSEWFRQLLDYQVQLFSLYSFFWLHESDQKSEEIKNILDLVLEFKRHLIQQIQVNKDHIDEELVLGSQEYRNLEREKFKVIQEFVKLNV